MTDQEHGDALAAILEDVDTRQDAFKLAIRIGKIALAASIIAEDKGRTAADVLQALSADWARQVDDDDVDD